MCREVLKLLTNSCYGEASYMETVVVDFGLYLASVVSLPVTTTDSDSTPPEIWRWQIVFPDLVNPSVTRKSGTAGGVTGGLVVGLVTVPCELRLLMAAWPCDQRGYCEND